MNLYVFNLYLHLLLKTLNRSFAVAWCLFLISDINSITHKTLLVTVPKSGTHLIEKCCRMIQQDPDLGWAMIDSTIVRAHACSAGYKKNSQKKEALGRSKGGFATKIHALTDALGNPLKFILTSGQRHDFTQAKSLCENITASALIGDKGYDSNDFVQSLKDQNCEPNFPSKSNSKQPRPYDEHLYKERHAIECFFGKIKHFRRVFSRFDKSAQSFLAFIYFAGVLIWLRQNFVHRT